MMLLSSGKGIRTMRRKEVKMPIKKAKMPASNEVPEDIPGVEKPVGKKPEVVMKVEPPQKAPIPDYARGHAEGFQKGFKLGLESQPYLESERRLAFDQGVKHIVTLAENYLVKEMKLASRDELAHSGRIPVWWIATLMTEFSENVRGTVLEHNIIKEK